jgi:hypothetical protein
MARRSSWILHCLAAATLLSGCNAAVRTQAGGGQSASTYAGVTEPRSILDLMRNTRIAVDKGLVLRRDFYTNDNLERFFGGSKVSWDQSNVDPVQVWGYVYEFGAIGARTILPDGRFLDALTFRFRRSVNDQGFVEANLLINIPDGRLDRPSFSEIEALFGKQWTLYEQVPWPAHVPYKTRTAPHGNDSIAYRVASRGLDGEMRFTFAFDGRLELATISVKGLSH